MTCLLCPTFAEMLTTYLAEFLILCPSSSTDIKMSGTGNPNMGHVEEQHHLQVNRRNLMESS